MSTRAALLSRAAHAVALPEGDAPEWVHLVPAGRFQGRDGRGPYELADAQAVIAASAGDLVIDRDHAIDQAQRGEAPAQGWIKELQARDDGIWGRVEWTPPGRQAIGDKLYRWLSPVFEFEKTTGRLVRILRAGLTNNPNLTLTALASEGDKPLDELLARLRALLTLGETADAAAITRSVETLVAANAAATGALATVAQAAGLQAGAEASAIATAIHAARVANPDPAKFVPIEVHTALQARVSVLETTAATERATQAVDKAISEGRIIPAQREWALAYHAKDPAGFGTFVGAQPQVLQPSGTGAKPPTDKNAPLSETERAVCARLGVSEAEYRKVEG